MRLLRYNESGELSFHSFNDGAIPPYAILSHTWGAEGDEVTFADLETGGGEAKLGYEKIRFCGLQAQRDNLPYFWIDTCCIDKSHNAEYAFAIRSMFRWYRHADRCYVYLSDVSQHQTRSGEVVESTTLHQSRWFTRGWTLQELLAPCIVEFFSREGTKIGDKLSMVGELRQITGIDGKALQGMPLSDFSVNERISWNEHRQTTVPADRAYSLMGILGVSLSPLDGESPAEAMRRVTDEVDKQNQCFRDLRQTDPRDDKKRIESTKGGLLTDSYRWVLDNPTFQQWRQNHDSRLLWVKGDPGKGKTMLSCGIISELQASLPGSTLLSYFFCQATDSRINSAPAVLRGLLYSLLHQQPSLMTHMRKKYDQSGQSLFEDANAWEALVEIFVSVLTDPILSTTYFIIDALDECITDLPKLLSFISKQSSLCSCVKWIVSSRNWPIIEEELNQADQQMALSLELNAESVAEAVNTFIQQRVSQLTKKKGYKPVVQAAVLHHLMSNANNTFLWVALVCQDLQATAKWNVLKRLELFPPELDALYARMMHQIDESEDAAVYLQVLAVAAVMYRPITLAELAVLVGHLEDYSEDLEAIREIIGHCRSFLVLREDTIYFVHQSAQDFLVKKASGQIFPKGVEAVHREIFLRSLAILSKTLSRDMYDLKEKGTHIDDALPPLPDPLISSRYPCVYWVDHLHDSQLMTLPSGSYDSRISDILDTFIRHKFIYWLEGLSLCKNIARGVVSMERLRLIVMENPESGAFAELVQDAHRFIMYHKSAIECYPMQTYESALIFSPRGSTIRKSFHHEEPKGISVRPLMKEKWTACLHTLEAACEMATFLYDSNKVVSACWDGTVKIWDTISGTCLRVLKGHTDLVYSVSVSEDSTRLASVSNDGTIKFWSIASGDCLSTLRDHDATFSFRSVIFSRDMAYIASGRHGKGHGDSKVTIWDSSSGKRLSTLEDIDDGRLSPMAFHNSENKLAVGFKSTIKIWDFDSDTYVQALEWDVDYKTAIQSLAFCRNSETLAAGDGDGMIMIFDLDSGDIVQILDSHTCGVYSLDFCHGSTQLASASDDYTVKLWDLRNSTCLQTFDGHNSAVHSVSFSHDSMQLASVSRDGMIKIWDTKGGERMEMPDEHPNPISSIVFSPDSTWLASAAHDWNIKVWDTRSGECIRTLRGHKSSIYRIVFSHDSKRLASAGSDETARVWDIVSGECLIILQGHTQQSVHSVAFSHDSMSLASSCQDSTIKLWSVSNGECLFTFLGHREGVTSVNFSHTSTKLVSLSGDDTIKIWDTGSGECLQTLECKNGFRPWRGRDHDGPDDCVSFSHDGAKVISSTRDCTIRIWDLDTASCLHILNVDRPLTSISLDICGLYLLSDIGPIMIPSPPHENGIASTLKFRSLNKPHGGLRERGKWLTYNCVDHLLLPSEHRSLCSAVSGNLVGIAVNGRVLVFTFHF